MLLKCMTTGNVLSGNTKQYKEMSVGGHFAALKRFYPFFRYCDKIKCFYVKFLVYLFKKKEGIRRTLDECLSCLALEASGANFLSSVAACSAGEKKEGAISLSLNDISFWGT